MKSFFVETVEFFGSICLQEYNMVDIGNKSMMYEEKENVQMGNQIYGDISNMEVVF